MSPAGPGDHICCPLLGVPLQSHPAWGAPSPSAPDFGTSHPGVQDRETGQDVRILLAEQMTPLWDPSHSYPFCRARVFWMPLHLAPDFLPRLKLCTWNGAFGAGLSGQAAHPIPLHCQQLGLRFHEISLHLPAAAICPGVPVPSPHPHGAGTEPGPCPASWAPWGLSTYCSPWARKREKVLDKSVLVPAQCRAGNPGRASSLCIRKAPGSASTRGWSAAALASSQRKKKEEKGIKERCLSRGCALGTGQLQLHHCWELQQAKRWNRGEMNSSAPWEQCPPLTGDSPEPPRDRALQVPIPGELDPGAHSPGAEPWAGSLV